MGSPVVRKMASRLPRAMYIIHLAGRLVFQFDYGYSFFRSFDRSFVGSFVRCCCCCSIRGPRLNGPNHFNLIKCIFNVMNIVISRIMFSQHRSSSAFINLFMVIVIKLEICSAMRLKKSTPLVRSYAESEDGLNGRIGANVS